MKFAYTSKNLLPTIFHVLDFENDKQATINLLVSQLCRDFSNHYMVFSACLEKDKYALEKINKKDSIVIIHTTARNSSRILESYRSLIPYNRVYFFLHVSYKYLCYTNRLKGIQLLRNACEKDNIILFVPSKEVSEQYNKYGMKSYPIQIGVKAFEKDKVLTAYKSRLKHYYGRIVTTCTRAGEYEYVKGIDLFNKIITNNNLTDSALTLGTDELSSSSIECRRFKHRDFLNILAHSLMYVQLSRYETYNVTAIEAKRMKRPVILLRAEGTPTCMNEAVYDSVEEVESAILDVLENGVNQNAIDSFYKDSIKRENVLVFKNGLEDQVFRTNTNLKI